MDNADREITILLARVLFAILHKCEDDIPLEDVRRLRKIADGRFDVTPIKEILPNMMNRDKRPASREDILRVVKNEWLTPVEIAMFLGYEYYYGENWSKKSAWSEKVIPNLKKLTEAKILEKRNGVRNGNQTEYRLLVTP